MSDTEAYERAREAHKEAWQMALDNNQPADVRREWEKRRDTAEKEMRAYYLLCVVAKEYGRHDFYDFPGTKENVAG